MLSCSQRFWGRGEGRGRGRGWPILSRMKTLYSVIELLRKNRKEKTSLLGGGKRKKESTKSKSGERLTVGMSGKKLEKKKKEEGNRPAWSCR